MALRKMADASSGVKAVIGAWVPPFGSHVRAMVSVMYSSYASKQPVDTENALAEIQKTRPLSGVMSEQIAYLRQWASQRTVAVD